MVIDYFGSALGDIPVKSRGSFDAVLAVLRANPRFSVFDVDDRLAKTLDALKDRGLITYPEPQPEYPWCRVECRHGR